MGSLDFPKHRIAPRITFEGGPGDTIERAIVIHGAPDERLGVNCEYEYLDWEFGCRGVDWTLERQAPRKCDKRAHDEMSIRLADGTQRSVVFDITEFYGKSWPGAEVTPYRFGVSIVH